MRILLIIALLTGLLLAPLAVLAEESAVMGNETEVVNTSEEATIADATIADLAPMFAKIHVTLLMATEEAYAYLLTNDTAEKQAYYDDDAASEEALAAFEDAAANTGENETVLVDGYEEVVAEFENTSAAVQESYAYPVLSETIEKDDAIADFADFDSQLALSAEKYPETSYDDLRVMKDEILLAAVTMFENYEKDGSVKAEDVAALETLVEKMNQNWMTLYGEPSAEEAIMEENPVAEDVAANAIA